MTDHQHPFPFDMEAKQVMQAFGSEVKNLMRQDQELFIDPSNVQRFLHGRAWQSHQSYDPDRVSELKAHEHQINVNFDDIVLGRLVVVY